MLNYKTLSNKPSIFRSLTGLEVSEFNSVYSNADAKYDQYQTKRLYRENRKRKVGAGHPFKLPLQERLLMFLIYYRLYITSTLTQLFHGLIGW